ncbi:MAG TPA: gamma-glutamylcyclotransferase family protein [Phnomibacter sp.]|nr:gamma-glutamylcyclotransferase family protein [Phnomibacter sp.]
MQQTEFKLFVYGSLRQGFNNAAYEYIKQYFELAGHGKARGILYDLGPYPAAVPSSGEYHIHGELYQIKRPDEFEYAIAQLDDYEGVDASYDQPALYRRALTGVLLDDGSEHNAWIYWYTGDITGKPVVESGDVLEYIKDKRG